MHRALIVLPLLLSACVGQTSTPSPPPTPAPSATTTPTATAVATASPSATPRSVRPFDRVLTIAIPGEPSYIAPDRERVAYVAAAGDLVVVDVATGATAKVHTPQQGWHLELDPHGLRGSTLVFRESRTDGQRTDVRIGRIDLRSGQLMTLDDFSGPFLGGGDNWQARAPITDGVNVVWTRVDDTVQPFLVSVMLARGSAVPGSVVPETLSAGSSAVWLDLEDSGRVLVSTLITSGQLAELVVWSGGHPTKYADRPSADGGPAVFVAGRLFWGFGPGIVRPIVGGALIEALGRSRTLDLGCSWLGSTAGYLVIACQGGGTTLVDVGTGDRIVTRFGQYVGSFAIVWREGTQWWLGTLPP